MQCDRTGATQIVGTVLCQASRLHRSDQLQEVEGHKIKALEIDHEYKVRPAWSPTERHKKEGA